MALSRRNLILAGIAGFIAWGLAVRQLPLLRYFGYAFVAGIVLTLISLLALVILTVRNGPDGFDGRRTPSPHLAFLSPERWKRDVEVYKNNAVYQPEPLYPKSFVVSAAIDGLLELASRDFISVWYGNISKSPVFANEVDRSIRTALGSIRDTLLKEDLVEIIVSRIVPILTNHLKDFDQAERAVRGKNLTRNVTESEELDLAIANRYREGKLHPAASLTFSDQKLVQQEHLRKLVVSLLPRLLPSNLINSRAVSVLIREIVACAVLSPALVVLSDPDTWNQLMEAYGHTALQDRKTVRRLRAALDEHASPTPKSKGSSSFPRLSPNDSERSFERFVRAIRRCNNLSDARRFRSHVASQLKRESMVEDQDQVYLRRLETGKRVLDQKVAKLSAISGGASSPAVYSHDLRRASIPKPHDTPLVDLLHSAAGLSYFMEYMDRQNLMTLVQFWIVVDGFRNPLEDDFGDDGPSNSTAWTSADRKDIALISETYLSKPELKVDDGGKRTVAAFLGAGKKATADQYRKARTVILTTQSAVLEEMRKNYYPSFKQSDLYYKYLTSDEASTASAQPPAPPSVGRAESERGVSPRPYVNEGRSVPPPMTRTTSQSSTRSRDLRRAPFSSNDIRRNSVTFFDDVTAPRRSVESDRAAPLFGDDYDTDPLAISTHSLGKSSMNGESEATDSQMIETMEAALNDIITNEPVDPSDGKMEDSRSSNVVSPNPFLQPPRDNDSARSSLDFARADSHMSEKTKPSIASLGLVNTSSRIGVFSDDDLFPDQKKFIEDEYADAVDGDSPLEEEIHEAAPGDLGLTEAVSALSADIDRLTTQESVVDTLTRKAELTNNTAELRILGKSKASLQREIRRKEMQRQQYIVQESDNSLYGRSSVLIKSIMVGKEEDGREYAMYLIEVHRNAGEQMPAATWGVPRRYSEFHELHQKLRMRYPSVRHLEFPRRRMVMKLQKEFLHKRRAALEAYLQQLLLLPEVCRSRDLRAFLSQQAIITTGESAEKGGETKDIVTRIYNSVADGMDDFLGNIAVLDQLSTAGQNLISAATNQLTTPQPGLSSEDSVTAAEAEAELNAFEDRELEPFVKPICDLFLEALELNKGNNWLRGRAVVVVLHQLLGGTIERKVRENAKSFVQDDSLLRYIALAKDTMWPPINGKPDDNSEIDNDSRRLRDFKPRTASEKTKSRTEASVMLATLIPDLAANVVGRANAQAAARRIFATMNNERLNTHLIFTILDEIVLVLFGEGGDLSGRRSDRGSG
ncbi:Intermediate filament protein [Arachnomyces sp. PD_36]|nr:Intermediate filament protein [Arachnomyces sp. PD_36]